MKTKLIPQRRRDGSALMLVMVMCAVTLVIMAAVMNRTSTVSNLNNRNNKYTLANTAAAAATEKVYARMAYDFQNYGLGQVTNNISLYQTNIPTAAENAYWGNFVFSDAQGNTNRVYINYLTNYSGALPSQYTNVFTTLAPIYRIIANAYLAGSPDIIGSAQEDVLLSMVPITTYAIFYNGDLEFSQCATMVVNGRTHANGEVCVGTSASLTFNGVVSATKTVDGPTKDGVSFSPWNQGTTFNSGYSTNIPSVTVAMTMTNSHAIIDVPPVGESPSSQQGILREYNLAHVLILITNQPAVGSAPPTPQITLTLQTSVNGVVPGADSFKQTYSYVYTNLSPSWWTNISSWTNMVFTNLSGAYSNQPYGLGNFLTLSNRFTDKREYQTNMYVAQIDVGGYAAWLSTNNYVTSKFSSSIYPCILYVADQRNAGTNKLSVVRLVNAAKLPNNGGRGFSVATPNPLYIRGNYNVTGDGVHFSYAPNSTTNSGSDVPAALFCDAITILSAAFSDATSSNTIGTASVSNTVNAAIITGNVPSTGSTATTFSGGVHNLMRMQENWGSSTLVLNTSIVVLYASQMATNQFRNPTGWSGVINPYYSPPTRQWGFDPNFYNPALQPPGVPTALVPIRFNWTVPPPGTTNNFIGNY